MDTPARAKLRAWLHRPKGSLGWIVTILTLLALALVYSALSPAWQLPMQAPIVLLACLVLSVALGWAVQRGVKRTVGKTIFDGHDEGWQARLAFIRAVARESNVLLAMLILLLALGGGTLWRAGRSVARIVDGCEANLQAQVGMPEDQALTALLGRPVCTCLAQAFLQRNGVIRLALFATPLQEVSDYQALTAADEQHCLAQFDLLPEGSDAVAPQ